MPFHKNKLWRGGNYLRVWQSEPIINRVCPQYSGLDNNNDKFWHQLILNHTVTHPSAKELTIILLSVAPSTSPLESS